MRGGATRRAGLALAALILFSAFDAGMRLDQRALCQRSDAVQCPAHHSIWAVGYSTLAGEAR